MNTIKTEIYRAMGFGHATLTRWFADQRGQGTVEYIGLVLLLAAVMAVVVTTGNGKSIGSTVIKQVKDAVTSVGS